MTKHSDTIIINGQHFNARTGLPLATKTAGKATRNLDGILPKHVATKTLAKPAQYTQPMKSVVKKPVMDMARSPAPHAPKHPQQPGQTLMRRPLAKPSPSIKRKTTVLVPNPSHATVKIDNLHRKSSAAIVDERKLTHAKQISKSDLIKRFAFPADSLTTYPHLSPVAARAVVAHNTVVNDASNQPSLDLFERAIKTANSHEQPAKKVGNKRQRNANLAMTVLACLLFIAIVAVQKLPSAKLQYASSRAGFHAAMPTYKPAGFSLGKLSYQAGAVSVSFHSNSDDRAFAITQKPSAWDSQTLREDFVTALGQQYHTATAGGKTVYLYGQDDATWVSDGVWYQVKSAGSLTEKQLIQLASSL